MLSPLFNAGDGHILCAEAEMTDDILGEELCRKNSIWKHLR